MGSGDESRFAVGLVGKLYDQDREEVFPKDVLNGENGWGFDGIHVELLPDEVIMKLQSITVILKNLRVIFYYDNTIQREDY